MQVGQSLKKRMFLHAGQRRSSCSFGRNAEAVVAEPEMGRVGNGPTEPYKSTMKLAKGISYLKQPAFLKAAMSTTLLAVAEFHVQIIGLSTEGAEANTAFTRERLVMPIEKELDGPKTRSMASSKAIWFVRSTAQFFKSILKAPNTSLWHVFHAVVKKSRSIPSVAHALLMTRLSIENPTFLALCMQAYLAQIIAGGTRKAPFTCDVIVVLGGNIVKSGERYMTTPYTPGTKKSFGAQGRVFTTALLYHLGVSNCMLLSTGKTDPDDPHAPSEAEVMKDELMEFGIPANCMHLEEESRTTEENARELAKLFDAEPFREKKAICVVTSSWHIRRTDAFLKKEGLKREGRTIKYVSSDTILCRSLPQFSEDMSQLYHSQEMRERIQDERTGCDALQHGTYTSRVIGEIGGRRQSWV